MDHTRSLWCGVMNEKVGCKLVGKNAEGVRSVGEEEVGGVGLSEYLKDWYPKEYYFTIMAKEDYWQGELSVGYSIFTAELPEDNYNKAIKILFSNIMEYEK